jgi:hypothetical protein
MELTVREWYEETINEKDYSFDKKIVDILKEINFSADLDKQIKDFS